MHEAIISFLLALACLAVLALSGRLVCLREEFATPARSAAAALLFWGILAAAVFHPVVSPGALAEVNPDDLPFAALFAGHALLTAFLATWWLLAWPQPLRRFLHLETASASDLRFGMRVGLAGWLLALVVGIAAASVLSATGLGPDEASLAVPPLLRWLAGLSLARKLLVVAIAMIVEEAFFRAFLQPRVGWLPATLLFTLAHAGYGLSSVLVSVFVLSLAIGWAFQRRRSLLPCIVAHGVFDAIQLLVVIPLAVDHLRQLA
jgi:membrane protease YdiL (CAAX protease family)